MEYPLTNERWDAIKSYLAKVWASPDEHPDNGLLLSLSDDELTQLFTKKRLALLRLVQNRSPKNATELSRLAGRRLSAVMRDLELLEKLHIVNLERAGKSVVPKVGKEILILPLLNLKTRKLAELRAMA